MRTEKDYLGSVKVPEKAFYGVFTQRALENFQLSDFRIKKEFYYSIAVIKKSAAEANWKLGKLEKRKAKAIISAAEELMKGKFDEEFCLDVFQAGAGTPYNMNVNEVIANRAIQILGGKKGNYSIIHPNDEVNMSQSTNDVIPTAMRITCITLLEEFETNAFALHASLQKKAEEFKNVVKTGRTHLQDAVPITLGEEFQAFAEIIERSLEQVIKTKKDLRELGIGGTAIGTGINTPNGYKKLVIENLSKNCKQKFTQAKDAIELTQSMDVFLELSNTLRVFAGDLIKICNDLILLNSGPNAGIGEIVLPAVEPGSSIMPGKVNPSIAEATIMCGIQVLAQDYAIEMSVHRAQLELNTLTPVIAFNLFNSITLLSNASKMLNNKCIKGIKANKQRAMELLEHSAIFATALNPVLGYEQVAEIVKEANKSGKSVKEIVLEKKLLKEKEFDKIIDLKKLAKEK